VVAGLGPKRADPLGLSAQTMPFRSSTSTELASADTRGLAAVRALVLPLCRAHAVELVSVAWVTERAGRTLRVTIERPVPNEDVSTRGWGVTLEDCAELSRDISQAIDHEEGAVSGSFHLEVSSPGLERDLQSIEDFIRFQGMLARAKLARPAPDGQRVLRGKIVAVDGEPGEERLTMFVDKKEITVPFADVSEANLVFEMTAAPRGSPRGSSSSSSSGSQSRSRRASRSARQGGASRAAPSKKRSQSKGSGS
jgi:ribosome maturation factor RimP